MVYFGVVAVEVVEDGALDCPGVVPKRASRFHFLLLLLNCIISATNNTVDIDTEV